MDGVVLETDRRILGELTGDGRLSVRALAERVRVSRGHSAARLERLEELGALEGFTAVDNPVRGGLGTSAYVTLTVRQNSWGDLTGPAPRARGQAHDARRRRRGRHAPDAGHDNEALRGVVLDALREIPGVVTTDTRLVCGALVNRWSEDG